MPARVGVVLSGSGVQDGSEITEAVAVLIALDRRGARVTCFAPDVDAPAINHLTGKPEKSSRNVRAEAARIARGRVTPLDKARADELDALILPGGFGAAKNLCDFAASGAECTVIPDLDRLMRQMHAARKPIGLACIAPVIAARVFGSHGTGSRPAVTIGTDEQAADAIRAMGGTPHNPGPVDAWVDEANRLVSTACYMNDVGPWTVYEGAERMVEETLRLTGDPASLIRQSMAIVERPV